jgi:CDGSH-type Zn-finger protein
MAAPAHVTVTACPNGPLLVRGDVTILREDGSRVPTHRSTIALCRCSGSQILPLCDGTHRVLGAHRRTDPHP